MFDEISLKKIDAKYFNIILLDNKDITLQSRNTGHYWYLHCTEYPEEQSLIIFHKLQIVFCTLAAGCLYFAEGTMVAGVEFAFADVCKLCSWRQDFVCPFQQIFLADGVGADVVASWLEDGHLINELFLNLWCGLLAFINRFCLHLQHLAFRKALLPFYLPKRIQRLFFRSEGIFFEKSFENSQGKFRLI